MNIAQDYNVLLDLFIKLVESQAGKEITSGNEWLNDAQALARKLFQHIITIQSISTGVEIVTTEGNDFSFVDHSSAIVITRAAIETLLIFHHIYAEKDKEQSHFNYKLWKLSGLLSRQNYPTLIADNQLKLDIEKKLVEELKLDIQNFPLFNKHTEKQKRQLLKGAWDFETSWQNLGEKAGFHPVHFRMTYNFLCGYSHASYISALQISQAKTIHEQHELTSPMLQIGGIIMAYFIFTYPRVFPDANQVLKANSEAEKVASNWYLTKERMVDIYGH